MTLSYSVPSGSDAHELVELLRTEGLTASVGKARLSGYRLNVHDEDADPDRVDAIARSVSPRAARVP